MQPAILDCLELLSLSEGELRGTREQFVERLFDGMCVDVEPDQMSRADYAELIARGGFPEIALGPPTTRFRTAWSEAYLRTVTAVANVEQVAAIRRPGAMYSLAGQLAARSGGELVPADLARDLLIDTALAAHLLGATADDLADFDSRWFGPLLESFVVNEVAKQATWASRPIRLGHYRDRDGREVDLILERGRDVVGIEVKASSSPVAAHAKHLAFLRDRLGERFRCGVVLHGGSERLVLGDRLFAIPVASVWA